MFLYPGDHQKVNLVSEIVIPEQWVFFIAPRNVLWRNISREKSIVFSFRGNIYNIWWPALPCWWIVFGVCQNIFLKEFWVGQCYRAKDLEFVATFLLPPILNSCLLFSLGCLNTNDSSCLHMLLGQGSFWNSLAMVSGMCSYHGRMLYRFWNSMPFRC